MRIAASLAPNDWQCGSAGAGSKGPRLYNWAVVPLKGTGIAGWGNYLVIRQNMETGEKAPDTAYILVFAPVGTTLQHMVEAIGDRWTVEECLKIGKSDVGLNEYEVRSWQGWYRHITLCMVVMANQSVLRLSSQTLEIPINEDDDEKEQIIAQNDSSDSPSSQMSSYFHLPMMVHLSVPEIKKLFYYIVSFKPFPTLYRVAWSVWRRIHQAWAHFYHSQRRIRDAPSYLPL